MMSEKELLDRHLRGILKFLVKEGVLEVEGDINTNKCKFRVKDFKKLEKLVKMIREQLTLDEKMVSKGIGG